MDITVIMKQSNRKDKRRESLRTHRMKLSIFGGLTLVMALTSVFSVGFSGWIINAETETTPISTSIAIGAVDVEYHEGSLYDYFGISINTTESTSSLSYYTYTKTTEFTGSDSDTTIESPTTEYYFYSNYINVVLDVDRENENMEALEYDSTTYSYIKATLNVLDSSNNVVSLSSFISSAIIQPYNIPNHTFDLTASSKETDVYYYKLKSATEMSLYELARYDHSYEYSSTSSTVPIEFRFVFDTSITSDNLKTIIDAGYSFFVSFELVSESDYQ